MWWEKVLKWWDVFEWVKCIGSIVLVYFFNIRDVYVRSVDLLDVNVDLVGGRGLCDNGYNCDGGVGIVNNENKCVDVL